jgi:fumarate reductase flavoprotein subunit
MKLQPKQPVIRRAEYMSDALHVPVAIVGAGACGLTAALMLHDAGIPAVVLERDQQPSGSTALSSGFIPAAGTRAQQAQGIADSPQRLAADIQAKAHGTAAAHLVSAYADAIAPAIDALQIRHGLDFLVLSDFLYPGHSVHRMHTLPEKTGAALMARLQQAAAKADVTIVTQAMVRELWLNSRDEVIGVTYERPDGSLESLACDALLLACNGFGGNADMVRELLPAMQDATFAGHSGNDGSAIDWGRALGARLADLGGYQGHGSWAVPQGALVSWALMMQGAVQINTSGQRFHDETQGYSEATVQVLAQPGGIAWNVFDQPLLDFARGFPDFCDAEAVGAVKTNADVAALASLMGCDVDTLQATLATLAPGPRAPDGRIFTRLLQAPFYAIKVTGALFHTQGGLDIDAHGHVLHEDASPFPNLLAAGGAARGVSGNAVWGYLSGNGLLSAIAGGYIAAHSIQTLLETPT